MTSKPSGRGRNDRPRFTQPARICAADRPTYPSGEGQT